MDTGKMKTLSVCMIVKNEESVLEGCLYNAAFFADEIIIVDTGSTDRTKEIAYQFTDKVYDFVWCDDFAVARNAAFEKAGCDYIMWLDADDRVDGESRQKICELKYRLHEKIVFAGYERPENGGIFLYPRIIRRNAGFIWKGIVHEHLVQINEQDSLTESDTLTADFVIRHDKQGNMDYRRNIQIMEKIPEQELQNSFWLCAQCFLDCTLADEKKKAEHYLEMAGNSRTAFKDRLEDYALINVVLKHHKKYDAMLKWNAMYLECKEKQ